MVDLLQRPENHPPDEQEQQGQEAQYQRNGAVQFLPCLLDKPIHLPDIFPRQIDAIDRNVIGSEAKVPRYTRPFVADIFVDTAALRGSGQENLRFDGQIASLLVGQQAWVASHQGDDEQGLSPVFRIVCCEYALAFQAQDFEVARQALMFH